MKEETLKKAKNLECTIGEYTDLLRSRKADYGTMLIKISCAYANKHDEYHGRVDKEVWCKMLDVVENERAKTRCKLAALTDDSEEGAEAEVTEETTEETTPNNESEPKQKRISIWRWLFAVLFAGLIVLCGIQFKAIRNYQKSEDEWVRLSELWREKLDTCMNRNERIYNQLYEFQDIRIKQLKEQRENQK